MPAAARQDPTAARVCESQGHRKTARRTTHWIIVHPFRRLRRRAGHRVGSPRHRRGGRWRTHTRPPQALPEPDHPEPQPAYHRRLTALRLRAALPHPRPPRGEAAAFADSLRSKTADGRWRGPSRPTGGVEGVTWFEWSRTAILGHCGRPVCRLSRETALRVTPPGWGPPSLTPLIQTSQIHCLQSECTADEHP